MMKDSRNTTSTSARSPHAANDGLGGLKPSPPTDREQVADQLLQSIDLSKHLIRAKAPPNADYTDIVGALNNRWSALTGGKILISQETLERVFPLSPVELQRFTGSELVFEAALCHEETRGLSFTGQIDALRKLDLHVASPASTAIVMAGTLCKSTEIGRASYVDHILTTKYRTQAVDPIEGYVLKDHQLAIKYDTERGIIPVEIHPKRRGDSIWCAGSKSTVEHAAHSPHQGLWRAIFGS